MATDAGLAEAKKLLVRCGGACADYGQDVVIGGRMALILYRLRDDLLAVDRPALATREVDVMVPRRLPMRGASIVERLAAVDLVPTMRRGSIAHGAASAASRTGAMARTDRPPSSSNSSPPDDEQKSSLRPA